MVKKDNIKCLILEDEYYTAFEIRRLLYAYKPAYSVTATFESCVEFKEFINLGNNVDLIVSDIYLADGPALKSLSSLDRPIPIILTCTEYPHDFNLPNLIGCIYKPITGNMLYKCLDLFEEGKKASLT